MVVNTGSYGEGEAQTQTEKLSDKSVTSTMDDLVLGELIKLDHDGNPIVGYLANGVFFEYPAISTKPIVSADIKRQVALMFVQGDVQRPIILGFIRSHLEQTLEATLLSDLMPENEAEQTLTEGGHGAGNVTNIERDEDIQLFPEDPFSDNVHLQDSTQLASEKNTKEQNASSIQDLIVSVDDDKVELTGKDEITLRCGESSLTLTKSGRILLRGKYIVSRASGTNRILGGSVQVN